MEFDLTPDPKVLIALTHTPLQPLDALCELIDNSLDSFHVAQLQGNPVEFPLIVIEIPGRAEVERGEGLVRVRDNGPGLTADLAEKCLRAGYSGNNPFDSLGLFGMGFNISTGKMGRSTRFMTTRRHDTSALEVVVDLLALQESHSYKVPVQETTKAPEFEHGTIVEVRGWWPEGNPNSGFIRKLASYSKPAVRDEIGRRYSTILREQRIRILLNTEPCEPFEHCIWDKSRYVERRGHGRIPAVFEFNELVGHQRRCSNCSSLVPSGASSCPMCHSASFRTLEERIRGWVGIQRFDDLTNFGIDLIRNGRAIRPAEQAAFFEYTDEFKKTIKDYPIDSSFGRIVGEVHLNHVPVDFLKQDFQRSSGEWQRAIAYLRGDSSLQPTQLNADKNNSPVFKLYQGYRKVRDGGKAELYMGYWDKEGKKSKRISREVEREYYEKFKLRVPGYYDDAEWYKQVEVADHPPVEDLIECPACGAQNLKHHEACQVCDNVLIGKDCINPECHKPIPKSAVSCPHCGLSQVAEIEKPWACGVCAQTNDSTSQDCMRCGSPRGTQPPASREFLVENSDKDDELSINGCSVVLADGSHSHPVDVDAYVTRTPIALQWKGPTVPLIAFKAERISIFIDKSHPLFHSYHVRPEGIIASEVAQYLYDSNRRLLGQQYSAAHSITNLTWNILEGAWGEVLEDSSDRVKEDIRTFFELLRGRLTKAAAPISEDLFDEMTEQQKKILVGNMLGRGADISKLGEMKVSGNYLSFADDGTITDIFRKHPDLFFDGCVWQVPYCDIKDLPESVVEDARAKIRAKYLNCMEDCSAFLSYEVPESIITLRARASVDFLRLRLG